MDLTQKRVLVTGGAGFLGTEVVRQLEARGCREVFVPRRRDYDLVEGDAVRSLYRDVRPEVVLHLAAVVGGIGANRENPARFFYENLMMGVQLLHEGWRHGVEKVVTVGTICAYPEHTPVPFCEDALWNGYPEPTNAPYGLAKKMLLVQGQAYREQYGLNAVYVLPVNLYGPGDNFELATSHVIPALIRKLVEAREAGRDEVVVWGDGSPSREFLHVRDAARGVVLAAERYDGPLPINLGTGGEITIRALTDKLVALCRFAGRLRWDTSQPNGQARRRLDVSRARELLGFEAEIDFDEGLRETIAWYEALRGELEPAG
jgi:GDP-L-fucose synthase